MTDALGPTGTAAFGSGERSRVAGACRTGSQAE